MEEEKKISNVNGGEKEQQESIIANPRYPHELTQSGDKGAGKDEQTGTQGGVTEDKEFTGSFMDYVKTKYPYELSDEYADEHLIPSISIAKKRKKWLQENKGRLDDEYIRKTPVGRNLSPYPNMDEQPDNPKSIQDVLDRGVVNVAAGLNSGGSNSTRGGADKSSPAGSDGTQSGDKGVGKDDRRIEAYKELPVVSFDKNGRVIYETKADDSLKDDNTGDVSDPTAPVSESATDEGIGRVTKHKEEQRDREDLDRKLSEGVIGIDEQISRIEAARKELEPETEEQRRKRERRERARKIIAAVGDGISAMSNLYFTSQYSPNINQDKNSQIKRVNDRVAALKAEREANADKYLNYSLRIGDLKNQRAATRREIEAAHEAQKIARQKMDHAQKAEERREAKEEYEEKKRALELQLLQGKINRADYLAESEKLQMEYMQKHNMKMPVTPTKKSSGGGGGKGGSGKLSTWGAEDDNGNIHYITASGEANAHSIAGVKGWKIPTKIVETKTSKNEGVKTTVKTTRTGDTKKKYSNTSKIKW